MDTVWTGGQLTRRQISTLTVNTASTGGTITVTVGGTRSVVVTPSTTNTTTTAAEIAAAMDDSAEGEFEELEVSSATNVVTVVGPDNGAPFTIGKTDGGSNSTTLATTAPLSPHDVADGANYSTGAIPAAADRLVLQDSDVSLLHNLDGLTNAITFLRRASFTGAVGLPDANENGYPEYRRTHLDLDATAVAIEQARGDSAGQFRLELTSASACTVTITGDQGGGGVGAEVVELFGLVSTSAVNVAGGSVAIAPKVGQAAACPTVRATDSTVRIGSGVTSLASPTFQNCTALLEASWSGTLAMDGGEVTVGRAAAGAVTIDGGRMAWKSTGNPGATAIGGGGELDLSRTPTTLTIGGTVSLYAGGTLTDPAGRGGNYSVQAVRCTLQEVQWVTPSGKTYAAS